MEKRFDAMAYAMGYAKGNSDGTGEITIESGITCTDDGNGNVTITTTEENGDG